MYKQHCMTNLCVIPVLWMGMQDTPFPFSIKITFLCSYLVGTFLLSPDLDLYHSIPSRNWGILRILWLPYSKIFRHRGWSHIPLVGGFTRLSYVLLLAVVFFLGGRYLVAWQQDGSMSNPMLLFEKIIGSVRGYEAFIVAGFAGQACADTVHLISDLVYSLSRKLGFGKKRVRRS